ncbi:MAG TPA: phospholipid carrier-dependent glycosyltransferase [Pyrinomonadaceae bacterium]|nr:phospholipid carrier-dependent glycosyltransferase [Pyrinomonadaceae bacterium]
MAARADVIITAGLRPDLFAGRGVLSNSKTLVFAALVVLILAGFGFRATGLSAEGLSEDELNKLNAVADYRANGLTGANGEHPMLMKALQAGSIIIAEKWNNSSFVSSRPANRIAPETALRLPGAIFGALSTLLIFLIASELFGVEVALVASALWAFDPSAIGLNRVAKEDTFLLFFFLLANVFWLRGQRAAESTDRSPNKYYWLTAASYGAMVASKYFPHLFCVSICYYWMFQQLPETRWRLGKKRLLVFFAIMGLVFLILSPTILLPETWKQMGLFAGGKRISHDGYEFMNRLYTQRFGDWLRGIPFYFYFVFTAVKLPLLTVLGFLAGLPLLFRRKLGDGRYFILFWFMLWVVAFCFPGGKFTRYYTTVLPAVLITSAIGIQWAGRWLAKRIGGFNYAPTALAIIIIAGSVINSIQASPHFRLFTNSIGGGTSWAGYYFPHDEFYDASMRDVIGEIAKRARPGARVASESPSLATYYAERAQRPDLVCVSMSDPEALKQLEVGDFIIIARGRRYFSNDAIISSLRDHATPILELKLDTVPSVKLYQLDQTSLSLITQSKN